MCPTTAFSVVRRSIQEKSSIWNFVQLNTDNVRTEANLNRDLLLFPSTCVYFYQEHRRGSRRFFTVRENFIVTCRFCLNTYVQIVKSGHRNEFASRSSLFVACTVIYHVQFIASELPNQIAQYVAYDWQHASEAATWRADTSERRCTIQSVGLMDYCVDYCAEISLCHPLLLIFAKGYKMKKAYNLAGSILKVKFLHITVQNKRQGLEKVSHIPVVPTSWC